MFLLDQMIFFLLVMIFLLMERVFKVGNYTYKYPPKAFCIHFSLKSLKNISESYCNFNVKSVDMLML